MGQVRATPSRAAEVRCPYCHDLLQSAREALIECPGCGTMHHGACIAELGRCTVLGCAQPIGVEALPLPLAPESEERRRVREASRGRVQRFAASRQEARESGPLRVPAGEDLASRSRSALRLGIVALFLPAACASMALLVLEAAAEGSGFAVRAAVFLGPIALGLAVLAWRARRERTVLRRRLPGRRRPGSREGASCGPMSPHEG